MKLRFSIILFLNFALCVSNSRSQTAVMFPIQSMFNGVALGQTMTITAPNALISDGQNLFAGSYINVPWLGTNPIVLMKPGSYLVTVPAVSKPVRITVPASTNTLNAANLVTSGPLFYFGTNGMANLLAGNNVTFVTNADGSISISSTGGSSNPNAVTNTQTGVSLGGTFTGSLTGSATAAAALNPGSQSNLIAGAVQSTAAVQNVLVNAVTNTQSVASLGTVQGVNNALQIGGQSDSIQIGGGENGVNIGIGSGATPFDSSCVVFGTDATTTGTAAVALGVTSSAAYDSIAIGDFAHAEVQDSIAIGADTTVSSSANASVAIGTLITLNKPYFIQLGRDTLNPGYMTWIPGNLEVGAANPVASNPVVNVTPIVGSVTNSFQVTGTNGMPVFSISSNNVISGNGFGLTNIQPFGVTNALGFWAAAPSGGGGGGGNVYSNTATWFSSITLTNNLLTASDGNIFAKYIPSLNDFICGAAGDPVITGSYDLLIGPAAGGNLTSGSQNIDIGYAAGYLNSGSDNIFIGYETAFYANSDSSCIAIGETALGQGVNANNQSCLAIGIAALTSLTNGQYDLAIGQSSQQNSIDGYGNTSVGLHSMVQSIHGIDNCAFGLNALIGSTNSYNTYIGMDTGNQTVSGPGYNTCVGYESGWQLSSGDHNIFVQISGIGPTNTSNSTIIGGDGSLNRDNVNGEININNLILGHGGTTGGTIPSPGACIDVLGDVHLAGILTATNGLISLLSATVNSNIFAGGSLTVTNGIISLASATVNSNIFAGGSVVATNGITSLASATVNSNLFIGGSVTTTNGFTSLGNLFVSGKSTATNGFLCLAATTNSIGIKDTNGTAEILYLYASTNSGTPTLYVHGSGNVALLSTHDYNWLLLLITGCSLGIAIGCMGHTHWHVRRTIRKLKQ